MQGGGKYVTAGATDYQKTFERLVHLKKNPSQDLPDLTEEDVTELTRSFNLFDDRGKGRI